MEFVIPTRDWEALTESEQRMLMTCSQAIAAAFAYPALAAWTFGPNGAAILAVPLENAPGPQPGGMP
jgi:hypothetical protein